VFTRFALYLRLSFALALCAATAPIAHAQTPGDSENRAYQALAQAYQALAQKDYDSAIDLFRKGLAQQSNNAAAHKDLAYTLLKAGENADARDEFEAAMRLNPADETAALEYAFLAFETKKPIEARRMFYRLRYKGSAATRATAEQAFQNIDKPLADGIARWQQALARAPNPNDLSTFSAHWELAQLAELRDELPLAAEQFEICRKLKPQLPELLLILARVWQQLNRLDEAHAALLAASRSSDSRTGELALEQMACSAQGNGSPLCTVQNAPRYPYPYEFLDALKLDPENVSLRRELAFLYLAMHDDRKAIEQFEQVLAIDPKDRLARRQLDGLLGLKTRSADNAAPSPAQTGASADSHAKNMGLKSFKLGYMHDAIKYLRQAHEEDPADAQVMLKLCWAYNLSNDDADAKPCFDRVRHADDPQVAAEAAKAFHALNGDVPPQTTLWALPMFSSRWMDLFTYSQLKRTLPLPWTKVNKLVSFYLSARFMGDIRGEVPTAFGAGYLSESSLIFGAGVSSKTWHRLTGWAEAGESVNYLPSRHDEGYAIPDYRGGVNFAKGFGQLLGSNTPGLFYETTADAIYVSRFDKDWMFYSQHRAGRTFHAWDKTRAQLLMNVNFVGDIKSQYWANTVEIGPGAKVHLPGMRPNVYLSADFLRGFYLRGDYYPPCALKGCAPQSSYNDLRVSFWYAFTK
jgi:tetratricopeptide (TPR) repeat protein